MELTLMKGGTSHRIRKLWQRVVTKGGGDDWKWWRWEVVRKGSGDDGKWWWRGSVGVRKGEGGDDGKWWGREVVRKGSGEDGKWWWTGVVRKGGGDDGKWWGREVDEGRWWRWEVVTMGSGEEGKWWRSEVVMMGSGDNGKWWGREVVTKASGELGRKPEHETLCFSVSSGCSRRWKVPSVFCNKWLCLCVQFYAWFEAVVADRIGMAAWCCKGSVLGRKLEHETLCFSP